MVNGYVSSTFTDAVEIAALTSAGFKCVRKQIRKNPYACTCEKCRNDVKYGVEFIRPDGMHVTEFGGKLYDALKEAGLR